MSDSAIQSRSTTNPACCTSRNTLALISTQRRAHRHPYTSRTPAGRATLESLLQRDGHSPRYSTAPKGHTLLMVGLGADHWTDGELIDQIA